MLKRILALSIVGALVGTSVSAVSLEEAKIEVEEAVYEIVEYKTTEVEEEDLQVELVETEVLECSIANHLEIVVFSVKVEDIDGVKTRVSEWYCAVCQDAGTEWTPIEYLDYEVINSEHKFVYHTIYSTEDFYVGLCLEVKETIVFAGSTEKFVIIYPGCGELHE